MAAARSPPPVRLGVVKRELPHGYELDDDTARIDREVVHRFIAEESYWGFRRERDVMDGLIDRAARNVGLYAPDAWLVYLADVFVLAPHRGRGLGIELVRFTVDDGPYAHGRWVLHTADAHGLYEKLGFAPGERLLERRAR